MPIYKDKDRGTWYVALKVKQKNGKTKQIKRRGFKKRKEAIEAEAKILLEVDESLNKSESFASIAEAYFNWYSLRRKQSSINVIKNIIYNHLLDEFGDMEADKIQPADVMKYQNKIMHKYAPEFLKKIHTTLSAVFNFGIKFHDLKTNPASIAGNFEIENDKKMEFWEYEEFKQFIDVVDEEIYKVFFSVLYYSGARKGELLSLTWGDVDFEERSININKTVYNGIVTKPKTKAANRIILLPSFLMNNLEELKKSAAETAPVKSSYVVFGEFHDSLSTTTLDRRYDKFIKLSGVKRIRLHDFRHSHASYLINRGVNPLVVAQRLGHSDVATTLNTYSHLYPSKQAEAVAMMEEDFD